MAVYGKEAAHDAFITGLQSSNIQLKLLETDEVGLNNIFEKACALDGAYRSSEQY